MNVEINRLRPGESHQFADLLAVFRDTFGMKDFSLPRLDHLEMLLGRDTFVVLVARTDGFTARQAGSIVGGLTAHILPSYYFDSSEVYIYDLAVSAEYQRKGVGRRLMEALAAFCRESGFREFFVQADVVDGHALEFYRATGGIPEQVVHFNYPI